MAFPAEARNAADAASGSLVRWLRDERLLRGPCLFVDYWANVLGLDGIVPEEHTRRGFLHLPLFRAGIDRPEVDVPRLKAYLLLVLIGPFLLPFRAFRRLGRYRLRLGGGESEVPDRLEAYTLTLEPGARSHRVDVRFGDTLLARDVLDPGLIAGFSSLFWAANKLLVAAFAAIVVVAVATPLLQGTVVGGYTADSWLMIAFPLLVLALRLVFREWGVAVLGALPVLFGRYLLSVLQPSVPSDWGSFLLALAALFALYLLADVFFVPRPVPPALLLYTADGVGRPYRRDEDAPWWLEGRAYWVWRYLLLTPAELNKFWERDWERVELWIRADGPEAGRLEWVVTDLHYRELWIPSDALDDVDDDLRRAVESVRLGRPGVWLLEVDADLVFHYPRLRGLTFLPESGGVPVRGLWHVAKSLWKRVEERPPARAIERLERLKLERGLDVLGDLPEHIVAHAADRLLGQPWRYWRYPLGATRRREPRLYDAATSTEPPAASDPALQIKR